MQIVNFLVNGALFVGFAIGLRRALPAGSRGATWGPLLIALVGLGLILAGIFTTDAAQGYPPGTPEGPSVTATWHGLLQVFTGAFPVFGALPLACLVMARTF